MNRKFISTYCHQDLLDHDPVCEASWKAEPVPELHPVAEFIESMPWPIRALILALSGFAIAVTIVMFSYAFWYVVHVL